MGCDIEACEDSRCVYYDINICLSVLKVSGFGFKSHFLWVGGWQLLAGFILSRQMNQSKSVNPPILEIHQSKQS